MEVCRNKCSGQSKVVTAAFISDSSNGDIYGRANNGKQSSRLFAGILCTVFVFLHRFCRGYFALRPRPQQFLPFTLQPRPQQFLPFTLQPRPQQVVLLALQPRPQQVVLLAFRSRRPLFLPLAFSCGRSSSYTFCRFRTDTDHFCRS